MKKVLGILCLIILLLQITTTRSFAQEDDQAENTKQEIIESQKGSLNISAFVEEAERYTKEVFKDISINDLLNAAIKGEIDNTTIGKNILNLLGKEVVEAITVIR